MQMISKEIRSYLSTNDLVIGKIIEEIPSINLESTGNVFFDLMSCVIEQQIHYRSKKKIFKRLLEKAEIEHLNIQNFAQFEERVLSTIKLSQAKLETILGLVQFFTSEKINWQLLDDQEVIDQLSSLKGIGKWTIDMILLYTLQRPNVFPVDDYHLKQLMVRLYNLNPNSMLKKQMMEVSSYWGNYKSSAVRILLAWKEHQ
jgi:DNA-3-methyladenine glycosylase II